MLFLFITTKCPVIALIHFFSLWPYSVVPRLFTIHLHVPLQHTCCRGDAVGTSTSNWVQPVTGVLALSQCWPKDSTPPFYSSNNHISRTPVYGGLTGKSSSSNIWVASEIQSLKGEIPLRAYSHSATAEHSVRLAHTVYVRPALSHVILLRISRGD